MSTTKGGRIAEGTCWHCKKRRLKCDLKKPECYKCQQSGLACQYENKPLQWIGGAAIRGRLKGYGLLNATSTTAAPLDSSVENRPDALQRLPVRIDACDPSLLIQYFTNAVLPRFQLSHHLVSLDQDAAMCEPAFREAVLAVSQAHHHYSFSSDSLDTPNRFQARQVALSQFRQRIENGMYSDKDAHDLFRIVILFCMLDGVVCPDQGSKACFQHLNGGFTILKKWNSIPTFMLQAGGIQAHLFSVFATMDLVHALLSGHRPYFESDLWYAFSNNAAWWGQLAAGDYFLTLLKSLSEMASLGSVVYARSSSQPGDILAGTTETVLLDSMENYAGSPAPDFTVDEEWASFCALWKSAGTIYIHRVLRDRPVDDEHVQNEVRKAVSSLIERPFRGMMAHCLIYPLLALGAHCICTSHQEVITEALSPSISYLAFGNLVLMRTLLQDIWGRHDMACKWWDMFEPVSNEVFLF